jgi:hypothetical protein
MANDYGVYQESSDPVLWVKVLDPLEMGSEDQAIDNLSYADAITIAAYLTAQGQYSFAPGRPKRRPHPGN